LRPVTFGPAEIGIVRTPHVASTALAMVLLGLSVCTNGSTPRSEVGMKTPQTISVTSPAFAEGQPIPRRHSCNGEGISPLGRACPSSPPRSPSSSTTRTLRLAHSRTGSCSTSHHPRPPSGTESSRPTGRDPQLGRAHRLLRSLPTERDASLPLHGLRASRHHRSQLERETRGRTRRDRRGHRCLGPSRRHVLGRLTSGPAEDR
jgi:hypothetical protein